MGQVQGFHCSTTSQQGTGWRFMKREHGKQNEKQNWARAVIQQNCNGASPANLNLNLCVTANFLLSHSFLWCLGTRRGPLHAKKWLVTEISWKGKQHE